MSKVGAVAKNLYSINIGVISFPFDSFLLKGIYYSNIVLEKTFATAPLNVFNISMLSSKVNIFVCIILFFA